jgi:hypothetical protein
MNREDVIRMAREAGASSSGISLIIGIEDFFERFAALVAAASAAAEREACAKLCEECGSIVDELTPKDCADAIRARGQG